MTSENTIEQDHLRRHRTATNGSNISCFMESSWEDICQANFPDLPSHRRLSGSFRSRNKSKRRFKFKFSNLFGVRYDHEGSQTLRSADRDDQENREDAIVKDAGNVISERNSVFMRSLAESDDVQRMRGKPDIERCRKHKYRLTSSENEATSARPAALSGRTRSVSESDKKTFSTSACARTAFSKKNKAVLSNRSIGIVGGEDFIINPTKGDKLVSYFHTQWNNVRYEFNIKSKIHLSLKSPIWLLGQCYTLGNSERDEEKHRLNQEFMTDFRSRIWFTYRREFPLLAGSSLTSDCGWGCMLRSGQMMLAQALISHFLGQEWKWNASDKDNRGKEVFHRQLIRWCGDNQERDQLFGLHKLVTIGQKNGKRAGDWYGPASLAFILQKAMNLARPENPLLQKMHVYVSQDSTVFKGDIADLLKGLQTGSRFDDETALVVLVPVRLGAGKINRLYIPCLKDLLTLKYSIGVIGGRPSHSLYFVGWQDNEFITLDPHYCQETVDVTERNFDLSTFHCDVPQKLSMTRMDPSCTLGFYCKNAEAFEDFCQIATEVQKLHCKGFPAFTFSDGRLSDYDYEDFNLQSFEIDEPDLSANDQSNSSRSSKLGNRKDSDGYVVF